MITLKNVSKSYPGQHTHPILNRQSIKLKQGQSIGLLGRNGAGKSTFLRLLAGVQAPDSGRIIRQGRVSWPVAFAGGLHGDMTGAQNARFVARLYGRDTKDMLDFCDDFAEIGSFLAQPVRKYSAGMRARLAFALSLAVPFDFYLLDEITSVGDIAFREKCERHISGLLSRDGGVVVSHSLGTLRNLCDSGLVLENGTLSLHENIEDAIAEHRSNMSRKNP